MRSRSSCAKRSPTIINGTRMELGHLSLGDLDGPIVDMPNTHGSPRRE